MSAEERNQIFRERLVALITDLNSGTAKDKQLRRRVGIIADRIVREVGTLLDDPAAYERLVCREMPFGDGHAAARVLEALDDFFGLASSATAGVGRRAL